MLPKIKITIRFLSWCLWAALSAAPAVAQEFHQTYDLAPGGTVSVSNPNGSIRVTSWAENRVRVDAVKSGPRASLDATEIRVNAQPSLIEIQTIPHGSRGRSTDPVVDYELKVPRTAILSALTSHSGEISVTGPVARLVARSISGSVTAREIDGEVALTSTSGAVVAERINGLLNLMTVSGWVRVNEVASLASARSTSGAVHVTRVKDDATITTVSGEITIQGVGGRVIARTRSGPVTARETKGEVRAESGNNQVTVENAGGRVNAVTINGPITIRGASAGARAISVSGEIEIKATSGPVEANTTSSTITLSEVNSLDVRAKTTSGEVIFQGPVNENGSYDFESFSGDVIVTLPAESNFNLTAKTYSGALNTDFPIQFGPGADFGRGRQVRGAAGKGGAELRTTGFSGNIKIRRAGRER
jgi:hypothetical protein